MNRAGQPAALERVFNDAWTGRGPLVWLLWPVALLFGVLAALRRALYQTGLLKTQRVGAFVVVVGNVVAGGSGKTPVVMALVRHLQARGWRVGVISRGYGRRATDCREVFDDSLCSDVGDEPALIKRTTSAPVFVAASRVEAAQSLLARHPQTQVIVCDDGLQHLALHRDLEICIFDDRGVGNGFLLPAGPLREHWPRAVDLVLHTGKDPAFAGYTARRSLSAHAVRADTSQVALTDLNQTAAKPLLAVAAIAKPEDFFNMLRAWGLNLARTIALPDHDDFSNWRPGEGEGFTVLCTEKDALKLWPMLPDALAVPLVLTPEPAFIANLDHLLSTRFNPALSSPHGHTTS
jgi:tetraacyldisaccharide 4'-kinase